MFYYDQNFFFSLTKEQGRLLLLGVVVEVNLAECPVEGGADAEHELRQEHQHDGHQRVVAVEVVIFVLVGARLLQLDGALRELGAAPGTGQGDDAALQVAVVELGVVLLGERERRAARPVQHVRHRQDEAGQRRNRHAARDPPRTVAAPAEVRQDQRQHDLADFIAAQHNTCALGVFF